MSFYGQVQIVGQQISLPQGTPTVNIGSFSIPCSTVSDIQAVALTTGANTITVPAAQLPQGCIITPTQGSTVQLILKGVSGDTGIHLSPEYPSLVSFDTQTPSIPSSFVINAAAGTTVYIQFF